MKGYATTVYIKGLEPLPARALYALTEDREGALVNLPLEGVPVGRNRILPYCAAHNAVWDGLDGCPLCAVSNSESGATNENDETL